MRQVQPAALGLDGRRSQAILNLLDRVIGALVYDPFFFNEGVFDVSTQAPPDAAAAAGLNEIILRAGVKSVLTVNKLRMQDDVALLRRASFEISQSLPVLQ